MSDQKISDLYIANPVIPGSIFPSCLFEVSGNFGAGISSGAINLDSLTTVVLGLSANTGGLIFNNSDSRLHTDVGTQIDGVGNIVAVSFTGNGANLTNISPNNINIAAPVGSMIYSNNTSILADTQVTTDGAGNVTAASFTGLANFTNGSAVLSNLSTGNAVISGGSIDAATLTGTITTGVDGSGLTGISLAPILSTTGIVPVADGTYTVGIGVTQNGTVTTQNGIITAIQEAS